MRKRNLLISAIVFNLISLSVFAWENPLKKYDLYADTHPANDYEQANSQASSNPVPQTQLQMTDTIDSAPVTKRRNEVLRESSRKVFSNSELPAGWQEHDLFYPEPSLESIKNKYKKSNFAGCMQEAEAYVQFHPTDSLGFYYLAMAYTKVGDKENAVKAYEKVIALKPNPMLVKYATNGRNCVLETDEKCYPNINEPDLIYPYANVARGMDLTPVDPQTLINRNLKQLEDKLSADANSNKEGNDNNSGNGEEKDKKLQLPFGKQDEKLDQFIKAPYGNGLSPELNKEYKQLQLKNIQQSINTGEDTPEKDYNNMENIKKFDDEKSEIDTLKLAYSSSEIEDLKNNPEYIQYKKEFDELRMMLGGENSSNKTDFTDLLLKQEGNMSPEMFQAIMMRDMMPEMNFINTNELL